MAERGLRSQLMFERHLAAGDSGLGIGLRGGSLSTT
jgi:hypothetical protein